VPQKLRINDETLDRILANEEELIPSSGFAASVMERIREEAAAPPPIPFPWKRAVPGIVLAAGVFGWGAVELSRWAWVAVHIASPASLASIHLSPKVHAPVESAAWVGIALAVSLVSWMASRRMIGARSF
jgi:hypothetical protein